MHFGPDGKLYVAVGENANGANAQTLGNRLGKILRINPDGSIPTDNPFYSQATGDNRAIWALGLRNPFTFAFQPGTGADVHQRRRPEHLGGDQPRHRRRQLRLAQTRRARRRATRRSPTRLLLPAQPADGKPGGIAIAGGAFYDPPTKTFPADFANDYFFGDFGRAFIWRFDPQSGTATQFATSTGSVVDIRSASDGSLVLRLL